MTSSLTTSRAAWALLALPAIAIGVRAVALEDGREATAQFMGLTAVDLSHFIGGGVALLSGVVAMFPGLAHRQRAVHRLAGRIYVMGVAVSGTAGALMATAAYAGPGSRTGFFVLALLWLATTGIALREVLARRIESHRRWMIQSFALCLSAVTLRILLPTLPALIDDFRLVYVVSSWACWIPNLIAAEIIVARLDRRARPPRTAS